MTEDKLREVLLLYLDHCVRRGGEGGDDDPRKIPGGYGEASYAHLTWMCREALGKFLTDRREKAMRWLGFVQGVLYCRGDFSVAQMRDHSRGIDPEKPATGGGG